MKSAGDATACLPAQGDILLAEMAVGSWNLQETDLKFSST